MSVSLELGLIDAAENGDATRCLSLIESGANINYSGSMGETPLHAASSRGHLAVVEVLLTKGANLFARDQGTKSNPRGDSPLLVSLGKTEGHTKVTQYLLSKGALTDEGENGLARVLHWAVRGGHSDALDLVLGAGGNINYVYKGDSNRTALHVAASFGQIGMVTTLLQRGADCLAMSEDGSGALPLHSALTNNHGGVADILIAASLGRRNLRGETALHLVAKSQYILDDKTVQALIDAQEGANIRDETGLTPLHWASAFDTKLELIRLLLDRGADLNARDVNGWTPLHVAARNGSRKSAELLIASGANLTAQDTNGKMPEQVASGPGGVSMYLWLEEKRKIRETQKNRSAQEAPELKAIGEEPRAAEARKTTVHPFRLLAERFISRLKSTSGEKKNDTGGNRRKG